MSLVHYVCMHAFIILMKKEMMKPMFLLLIPSRQCHATVHDTQALNNLKYAVRSWKRGFLNYREKKCNFGVTFCMY